MSDKDQDPPKYRRTIPKKEKEIMKERIDAFIEEIKKSSLRR